MASNIFHMLLVASMALAVVDIGTACRSAKPAIARGNEARIMWYCPPEQVLFVHEEVSRCFPKCEMCPNGFCNEGKCHCFPGTVKDKAGVCGKICTNCDDGWCSSVSKCECNQDYTRIKDRCVPLADSCQTDYNWDPETKTCIPYEYANSPDINVRSDD